MKMTTPMTILNIFQDAFQDGEFKLFRVGDPIIIPESMMPALIISETQTGYDVGPTGFDEVTHTLLIQVILNKKDEIGNPDQGSSLDEKLDQLIQGRDETSGELLSNTILGVLRRNITMGNLMIQNTSKVRKGIIPRSEDLITAEAHIDIEVTELQQVSNRV
jgi:hypothetical protein